MRKNIQQIPVRMRRVIRRWAHVRRLIIRIVEGVVLSRRSSSPKAQITSHWWPASSVKVIVIIIIVVHGSLRPVVELEISVSSAITFSVHSFPVWYSLSFAVTVVYRWAVLFIVSESKTDSIN